MFEKEIVKYKFLNQLAEALGEKGMTLTWGEEVPAYIAKNSFSQKFGARNMRRYIQKEVEDHLAELIIADYRKFYSFAKIDSDGESLTVHCM